MPHLNQLKNPWLILSGGAVLYYLAAMLGMSILSLQPSNITLLWLPSGIGLVMCLTQGARALPFIALSSFLANYPGMATQPVTPGYMHTLIAASADAMAPWLATYLFNWRFPEGIVRSRDMLTFMLFICFIPTGLSSILISSNLVWGGYIEASALQGFVIQLILADSLGILLVYPIYALYPNWSGLTLNRLGYLCGFALCLISALLFAFNGFSGAIYMTLAILVYVIFTPAGRYLPLLSLITVFTLLTLATQGLGPFDLATPGESLMLLMSFAFFTTLTPLVLLSYSIEYELISNARDRWRSRATQDDLTGLLNRRGFTPVMRHERERCKRLGYGFVLAVLDIDHFKKVNDRYGHQAGDSVLQQVAQRLQKFTRSTDSCARIGGEEFCILLPAISRDMAALVLERLRLNVKDIPPVTGDQAISISLSIGAIHYQGDVKSTDELFKRADKCLYEAKKNGRDQLIIE